MLRKPCDECFNLRELSCERADYLIIFAPGGIQGTKVRLDSIVLLHFTSQVCGPKRVLGDQFEARRSIIIGELHNDTTIINKSARWRLHKRDGSPIKVVVPLTLFRQVGFDQLMWDLLCSQSIPGPRSASAEIVLVEAQGVHVSRWATDRASWVE
jgi:hypothetical protein